MKYEGDKAVASKAGKCGCFDPACNRVINTGDSYYIGPQKDYAHGPYAYSRIHLECKQAAKYQVNR